MHLLPPLVCGQKLLERLLVADQVVVDEVDMTAEAQRVKALDLGEHLFGGFGTRFAAVELDDVAELAGERAAARILDADVEVVFELEQIEARWRGFGDVGREPFGRENAASLAALPGGDEVVDDILRFAQYLEVRALVNVRARGDIGTADHDGFPMAVTKLDEPE